jgi:hypothetical protein
MKKLATLTTMTFLLGTVLAFAQAPANQETPAPAAAKTTAKTTKKHQKTTKKPSGKKTTTTAPAAQN